MNFLQDKFLKYKQYLPEVWLVILGILIIVFILLASISDNHEKLYYHTQLNNIQKQIVQLSDTGNTADFKSSLSGISNELTMINNEGKLTAKSSDLDKISSQINLIKQNIDELKKLVTDHTNGKEFLDAKVLPFQVMSVDVISQQPFVSIDYDHHITPLGVGDTIAGWQITDADYATSQVEFKNTKNQYVKVNLQG